MSVYHSIRGSVQPSTVEEDVEDQDGLVLVDLNAEPEAEMATIHPAERISGQVCIPIQSSKKIISNINKTPLEIPTLAMLTILLVPDDAIDWSKSC